MPRPSVAERAREAATNIMNKLGLPSSPNSEILKAVPIGLLTRKSSRRGHPSRDNPWIYRVIWRNGESTYVHEDHSKVTAKWVSLEDFRMRRGQDINILSPMTPADSRRCRGMYRNRIVGMLRQMVDQELQYFRAGPTNTEFRLGFPPLPVQPAAPDPVQMWERIDDVPLAALDDVEQDVAENVPDGFWDPVIPAPAPVVAAPAAPAPAPAAPSLADRYTNFLDLASETAGPNGERVAELMRTAAGRAKEAVFGEILSVLRHRGLVERDGAAPPPPASAPPAAVGGSSNGFGTLCVVCMDAPRTHTAAPCGHLRFCGACTALLNNVCPVCRAPAFGFFEIFR